MPWGGVVIIIFVALLVAVGVLFGMQTMVVDVGFQMGQHTIMQNSADAGALAAARLLAASVGNDSPVNYVVSDNDVHARALQFAAYNRAVPAAGGPSGGLTATYQTAVEYLPWISNACKSSNVDGSPFLSGVYTYNSNTALVAEVGGTRNTAPPAQLGSVPSGTCGVRVIARMTHSALFGQTLGTSTEVETASAAAQVFKAPPPTTFSDVWPITRWLNAPGCTFTINSPPCTFWDSQGPPNGNFKLAVDMSQYSDLVYPSPLRPQHILDYDHTYPGNSTNRQTDLGNWLTYGWRGQLRVGDARCSANDPAILQFANCTNSRLETYNGTLGSNVGAAMRTFISNHAEGIDTSGQNLGRYVTLHVFLWRYGEKNVNLTTDVAASLWTTGSSSNVDRVILDQVRCFRFYEQTVSNSGANGYYVSCLSDGSPGGGPPSTIADTVAIID